MNTPSVITRFRPLLLIGMVLSVSGLTGCDAIFERHPIVGAWELSEAQVGAGTEISRFVTLEEDVTITPADIQHPATLTFRHNGEISGRTCNWHGGRYVLTADMLTVRDWLSTRVGCGPDGSPDDIIAWLFTSLSVESPLAYELAGDVLTLASERMQAEFRRAH